MGAWELMNNIHNKLNRYTVALVISLNLGLFFIIFYLIFHSFSLGTVKLSGDIYVHFEQWSSGCLL